MTAANDELLADLFDRAAVVLELDGPQIEAFASGLFPLFDTGPDSISPHDFVEYCRVQASPVAALLCAALTELGQGDLAAEAGAAASTLAPVMPPNGRRIGASTVSGAWRVEAPFGRSLVLGFDCPAVEPESGPHEDAEHTILIEVGADGVLEDLQLAGRSRELLAEAAAADDRVIVTEADPIITADQAVDAWPDAGLDRRFGPGVAANQHFVRARIHLLTGQWMPVLAVDDTAVDVRRGLDDEEFEAANRAARSTLRAAVGEQVPPDRPTALHEAWVAVVRGTAPDLSGRERDALLWLEWADWLGAGIGLLRDGADAVVSGEMLVDHVNRCPEVSSTIDKDDREYAAWAFDVALDVLADAGVLDDAGRLTDAGREALGPALVAAWT